MINTDKENFLRRCKEDKSFVENIVVNFHKLYYYSSAYKGTWKNTHWLGVPIQKNPMDCFVYQELINNIKPDYIIETGTNNGGSASFFATICDAINHGSVISIDIDKNVNLPYHERIAYLLGSSTDSDIINFIKDRVNNKKVLVILDSDHSKDHVLKELEIYNNFVSIGSCIIAEDVNICGRPVIGTLDKEGPYEAVQEFLKNNFNFIVDDINNKFYLSFCDGGILRRIK